MRRLAAVIACWTLLAGTACAPRVLVVGLDGVGWDLLDPLIEGGYVPTLARLVEEGARAELDCRVATGSEHNSCFCPPVWGSVVTGRDVAAHGLGDFGVRSIERRASTIWDVNKAFGGNNTLLSLHNAWPPEPAADFEVTEPGTAILSSEFYEIANPVKSGPAFERPQTWTKPPFLLEALGLLPFDGERRHSWLPSGKDRVSMATLSALAQERQRRDETLPFYERVPEFDMVLLHSTDRTLHMGWGTLQARPGDPIDVATLFAQADTWRGPFHPPPPIQWGRPPFQVMEADRWLGELLEQVHYDYVVLLSDHAMAANPQPGEFPSGLHLGQAFDGILVIHGPGVVLPGVDLGKVTLFEVAPTIAYLMGLPISEELPGRVLEEAIDELALYFVPPETTPSWQPYLLFDGDR